jgi:broad specificity phosphatase PhoE
MKLLFIRHGESVANTEGRLQGQMDSPLTTQGREQAHALARRLVRERWPVSSIYSSDLCRAADTAGLLGAALEAPVFLDERLREYDVGVLTGLTRAEIEQQYPELWRMSRQSPIWPTVPDEEGSEAFRQRIASVLEDIRNTHEDEQVVAVVSHGRTLGMMLMYLLGIDLGRRTLFRFGNVSITVVEVRPHGNVLACLNDMCHLKNDLSK